MWVNDGREGAQSLIPMALSCAIVYERTSNPIKKHSQPLSHGKDAFGAQDNLALSSVRYQTT